MAKESRGTIENALAQMERANDHLAWVLNELQWGKVLEAELHGD